MRVLVSNVVANAGGLLPGEVLRSSTREFDVLRIDQASGRMLLKMPPGSGHQADSPGIDAWWEDSRNCRLLEQPGADQGSAL